MSNQQLFGPRVFRQIVETFARAMFIGTVVVTFTLIDGSSFNARSLRPSRNFVLIEAYDQEGGVALKLIPWANIRDIEVKKEKPEIMEKMAYRL